MTPAEVIDWANARERQRAATPTAAEAMSVYREAYGNPRHPLHATACEVVRELAQAECRARGVDPNAPASAEGFAPSAAPSTGSLFR